MLISASVRVKLVLRDSQTCSNRGVGAIDGKLLGKLREREKEDTLGRTPVQYNRRDCELNVLRTSHKVFLFEDEARVGVLASADGLLSQSMRAISRPRVFSMASPNIST